MNVAVQTRTNPMSTSLSIERIISICWVYFRTSCFRVSKARWPRSYKGFTCWKLRNLSSRQMAGQIVRQTQDKPQDNRKGYQAQGGQIARQTTRQTTRQLQGLSSTRGANQAQDKPRDNRDKTRLAQGKTSSKKTRQIARQTTRQITRQGQGKTITR